jgi:ribosomal protein S18 acetylase RimI-like enzyme
MHISGSGSSRRATLADVDIRRLGPDDAAAVVAASGLFDGPASMEVADRFLRSEGHSIFIAYEADRPVGFVTGVEMTHPDKGTEMFLYELAVDEEFRRRGIGTALVTALRDLAIERGCYGMWVMTERDNLAAMGTYRATGTTGGSDHVMLDWTFGSG